MRGGAQFQTVVSAIQRLPKSQWLKHEGVLAHELGLDGGPDYTPVDELDTFVKSIENGGSGAKYNNTFVANPEPFDAKTNLTDFTRQNRLRLNYIPYTGNKALKKVQLTEPSADALALPAKFYHTGKASGCPSLDDQLNAARYAMGTHQALRQYPAIGK